MDYTEKTLSVADKYRGRIIYVHVDNVSLPDGGESRREIVEHSGGVAIIPVDDEGNVYCVRQYRYAVSEHVLEVPAGKLEDGEDPLHCAVRELSEETGFTAESFVSLGDFYPSPGYCKERIYIYLATGLKKGRAHLDEGEFLDVEKHPLSELLEMVERNELIDGKTVIAVLKAKNYLLGKGEAHV
jgi:ADP-ribose pyrophosphatase